MGPTLMSVPPEIRQKIYAHLLLEESVMAYDRVFHKMRTSYTTSLFTVNKQLSAESLEYFYTSNAFVLSVTNMVVMANNLRGAFPIFSPEPGRIKHYALRLDLNVYDESHAFINHGNSTINSSYSSYGYPFVISAKRLPNLVAAINAQHALFTNKTYFTEILLGFRTDQRYFKESGRVLDILVNGVKGLRKIINPAQPTPINVKFHGALLADEKVKEILDSTNPPDLSYVEIFAEIKKTRDRGNAFYRAENYPMAQWEYLIAGRLYESFFSGRSFENFLAQFETRLEGIDAHEFMITPSTLRINLSLTASKLGDKNKAIYHAQRALEMLPRGFQNLSSERKVKARAYCRLGSALADREELGAAIKMLRIASSLRPNDMAIKELLEGVEKKFSEKQKCGK